MSRGLGAMQRKIIEVGGATSTVWDTVGELPLHVYSLVPWGKGHDVVNPIRDYDCRDGKHRWKGSATARSASEFQAIRKRCEMVQLASDSIRCTQEQADLFIPALWSRSHLLVSLFPELFGVDHRQLKWLQRADGICARHMVIPDRIRKAKASANATVTRALASMEKRGLVVGGAFVKRSEFRAAAWGERATGYFLESIHVVVDSVATVSVAGVDRGDSCSA